ncbi:hypothetical protein FF38_11867 [Lucilia cuprina]|uniref:Uncharacterized protein n=1 Tax=Lucilia cuprina TaxID=7375 RepID=A0A0L0BYH8_LUCCU|nr:hypothetical protein CVS40_0217 [Lucilia cuprina]KNC25093.1 hypothetical protein FF38_11867 [Lucilia cuprina]
MKPFQQVFYLTAIVALGSHITAVPVDPLSLDNSDEVANRENEQTEDQKSPPTSSPVSNTDKDLETSNSNQETTYVLPEHHASGGTASGHFDPSLYAGYLTPEAFQQYLAQFAGAFGPYGYPGYGPAPVYPAPYAVQTGYEGFLVPSPTTSLTASGTVNSSSGNILTALSNLIPALMNSTIFRVVATVIGAILMLIFGGAVTTAICNLTPLCDISFKAVTYLRGNGAADMGRMLAEEMTPERVRRASEFVRSAIRKYTEMQKVMAAEKNMNQ